MMDVTTTWNDYLVHRLYRDAPLIAALNRAIKAADTLTREEKRLIATLAQAASWPPEVDHATQVAQTVATWQPGPTLPVRPIEAVLADIIKAADE